MDIEHCKQPRDLRQLYIYLNRDVGEQNLYTHNNKVVSFITLKAFHPFSSVDSINSGFVFVLAHSHVSTDENG